MPYEFDFRVICQASSKHRCKSNSILGYFTTNNLKPFSRNSADIGLKRKVTLLLQIEITTTTVMNILLSGTLDLKIQQSDFYIRSSLTRECLAKVGTTVCSNYLSKCTVVSMLEQSGTKCSFIPS